MCGYGKLAVIRCKSIDYVRTGGAGMKITNMNTIYKD